MTLTTAVSLVLADRRRLALAVAAPIAAVSLAAVAGYPGTGWLALVFCIAAGGLLPMAIALGGDSPFRLLTAAFLTLGFWGKFAARFAMGAELVEPTGLFPGTPEAWDAALRLATAGLAGVWIALLCTWRLRPERHGAVAVVATPSAPVSPARVRATYALLIVSCVPALLVFAFNNYFAILRIGVVPKLALHPYVYVLIAFSVTWGILLWSLTLTWWLVEQRRLSPAALVHVATFAGAAAALSMGSRAQMLLHVLAGGAALWHGLRWRGWQLSRRDWWAIPAVFAPVFAATLLLVSIDRALSFPPKPAVPIHGAPTFGEDAAPQANGAAGAPAAGEPGARGAARGPNASGTRAATPRVRPADQTPVAESDDPEIRRANRYHRLRNIPLHVRRLFVLRWVGLEGVMTTVGSEEPLGAALLQRALVEPPSAGVDAIYQRMARTIYARSDQFVFLTIPGPVAFAAYSGSALVCFGVMAALVLIGTLLEHGAGRITTNPAVAAVAGVALAYLLVQLNFPVTLWFFVLELIAATLFLAAVGWWFRSGRAAVPAAPADAADAWR